MTTDKREKGAQFTKYFGPLLEALRKLGGSGTPDEVVEQIAADLGLSVTLVDRWPQLGGVCLNVGCIPSKALLHMAKVITEADEAAHAGISFGKPTIDIDKLRAWKDGVLGKLTKGLTGLAKQRKVQVVTGRGEFASANAFKPNKADWLDGQWSGFVPPMDDDRRGEGPVDDVRLGDEHHGQSGSVGHRPKWRRRLGGDSRIGLYRGN